MVEQCCALSNNRRCENYVIEHTNHCQIHYGPAIKLYKTYKKICDVAYKLDLNKQFKTMPENINYLMDCYRWFNKAFNARMEHRKFAFVPECYDAGHDYQFVFIKNKILECEKLLCELNLAYERKKVTEQNYYGLLENQDGVLVVYEPIKIETKDISEVIIKHNRERKKIEEDVEEIMEKYRKENEEILRKRDVLQNLIVRYLDQFLEKHNQNRYIMYVAMYSIIAEISNVGYFVEKYEPEKCCHKCGNYVSIPFVLSCRCLYNYSSFKRYLNKIDDKSLKILYKLLLRERTKYEPIFFDFLKLYYLFEDETLFMNLEVMWNEKLNRLVMQQRTLQKEEKHSKILARMRLKKKILEKYEKYDEMFEEIYNE
jgi:hypothetical protein